MTHAFGISETKIFRLRFHLANGFRCGHHSYLVLLEQDGAPLVATRDRLAQPIVDKVHDDLRWDDVLEELLAMLVALAVFLLRT